MELGRSLLICRHQHAQLLHFLDVFTLLDASSVIQGADWCILQIHSPLTFPFLLLYQLGKLGPSEILSSFLPSVTLPVRLVHQALPLLASPALQDCTSPELSVSLLVPFTRFQIQENASLAALFTTSSTQSTTTVSHVQVDALLALPPINASTGQP